MSTPSILFGLPYREEKAKKHSCKTIFPHMLSAFIGITLKVVDEESKTSYYCNDGKITGKASISLGMDLTGKSLDLGLIFYSFLFPT